VTILLRRDKIDYDHDTIGEGIAQEVLRDVANLRLASNEKEQDVVVCLPQQHWSFGPSPSS